MKYVVSIFVFLLFLLSSANANSGKYSVDTITFNIDITMLIIIISLCAIIIGVCTWAVYYIKMNRVNSSTEQYDKKLKIEGFGLRFKFGLFTVVIISFVIIVLSLPLFHSFSNMQRNSSGKQLLSKSLVLIEGVASSATLYFQDKNIIELSRLLNLHSTRQNSRNITVLGREIDNKKPGITFLWATNLSSTLMLVNNSMLEYGKSEFDYKHLPAILNECSTIDSVANILTEDLRNELLYLKEKEKKASDESLPEIQKDIIKITSEISTILGNLSNESINSFPKFNLDGNKWFDSDSYLFYQPIMYFDSEYPNSFIHGIVLMDISTIEKKAEINSAIQNIRNLLFGIATIAFIAGVLASFAVSTTIIRPIKKMAAYVAEIQHIEDPNLLAEQKLILNRKDELGILGDNINEMVFTIAKASSISRDLTIGREVQKMFIPLETDEFGKKLTCGYKQTEHVEFFGYYEGAQDVSGDYFDYIQLDSQYYAIMKCDIAGKGVPAAFLMIEIATLFLSYFKEWEIRTQGVKINDVVTKINDFIESRGFEGRFASFTLCLMDTVTGDTYVCNAGDNILHLYDYESRKIRKIKLHKSSAAGVFPSNMLSEDSSYQLEKFHLNSGDMIFLFTDGLEESKRFFRDSKGELIKFDDLPIVMDNILFSYLDRYAYETLGSERVIEILESVLTKKDFSMSSYWYDKSIRTINFEFSKCKGTMPEAIMALVSIEKIFRGFILPTTNELNKVKVDKKIDSFLSLYFKEYEQYCNNKIPNNYEHEYLYYTNMEEDGQYDDIAILGIRKK